MNRGTRCTRQDVASFIRMGGERGRTFTEIQRFVCEKNGLNFDEKKEVSWNNNRMRRRYRGYWCTSLLGLHGCFNQRVGILETCSVSVGKFYISKDVANKQNVFDSWQNFLKQSIQENWDK